MLLRATLIAAAIALLSFAALAHADTPDQQFLNIVRSNNVGGQDDALIAYAHERCSNAPWAQDGPALIMQVGPGGLDYIVRVAASQVYCPGKIATPIQPPPISSF